MFQIIIQIRLFSEKEQWDWFEKQIKENMIYYYF